MVFVKVRETYDLQTVKGKMSVIAIHTPDSKIIKANFPGLLMQCKAYRPYACDVKLACASVLPMDPLGVGLEEGSVAPEDLFNPILYKACSNFGMSQIEARINALSYSSIVPDVNGPSASIETDDSVFGASADQFKIYYGLLSNAHEWKHANPQSGLSMTGLKPLVYEILYNIGDNGVSFPGTTSVEDSVPTGPSAMAGDGTTASTSISVRGFRGNAKPMPMINCTAFSGSASGLTPGFNVENFSVKNCEQNVPAPRIVVGAIIVPPSKLHELFYRMVVEWTLEFSMIRPISEIVDWAGLQLMADVTHYQNYDYASTKKVLTGDEKTVLEGDASMASANVDIKKVM